LAFFRFLEPVAAAYFISVADLIGEGHTGAVRRAEVMAPYEFLIRAVVTGSYNGDEEVYGVSTRQFSFGADLSAVWPDTGETIVQVTIPTTNINSSKDGTAMAARDSLARFLLGQVPVSAGKKRLYAVRTHPLSMGDGTRPRHKDADRTEGHSPRRL